MDRSARCLGVILLMLGFIYVGIFVGLLGLALLKKPFPDHLKFSHLTGRGESKKRGNGETK